MNSPPTPELHVRAAAAARQRGNSAEELRLLDEALRAFPGNPLVLNARGMRALADGDFDLAQCCFAAAAAADPQEPALWTNLATAQRAAGDHEGEQQSLERVLAIDQRDFVAQLRLAELHQRLGRKREAVLGWRNVVQMAAAMPEPPPRVVEAFNRGQAYLAAHGEDLIRAIDATLGGELAKLGPAAKRFKACVEHAAGRRIIYRNECHGVYYPFLPADEFFDSSHFPWFADLEARTPAIRDEALALLRTGTGAIRPYVRQDPGTPQNKWSALDNSLDWSACFLWEYGTRNDAVCDLCPETAAILDKLPLCPIPGKAPTAFFSVLRPGAHIPPHTGVSNTRTIIHLPLVVPPGCAFRVGAETRPWVEGEAFAFDDTIEHEAWNRGTEPRIVLIFDVWNPHLTEAEQALLMKFFAIAA